MKTYKIIFTGCGHMGGALLKNWAGHCVPKKEIFVAEHKKELLKIYKKSGIACSEDISVLRGSSAADLLVFAVKPDALEDALRKASFLIGKNTVILSIAAGKSVKFIEKFLPFKTAVVRVMPNMGVSSGFGVSGMFANARAGKKQKDFCFKLMSGAGLAFWVKKEEDLHLITAAGGSSPAYIYEAALALQRSAQALGLDKELAGKTALNVLLGSAAALQESGCSLEEAAARIATPGGTTEAAVKVFETNDALLKLYKKAMNACIKRSKELGK